MERGTLLIFKTKKGYAAKIAYQKTADKIIELPVGSYLPQDDKHNNTECTFKRENGILVQLIAHDGEELVGHSKTHVPNRSSQNPTIGSHQPYRTESGISDSFSSTSTFLPKDTQQALARLHSPDNFALKLNKAARFDGRMGKFQFFKRERKGENYEIKAEFGNVNFQQLTDRELANAKSRFSDNSIFYRDLAIDWRMAQGLGIESVYETSLTLHHTYGIPYIPASALKGIVRSWIIMEAFGQKEEMAIKDEQFCTLFGCPSELVLESNGKKNRYSSFFKEARQGKIVFFDAFPLTQPEIEIDVMNPHYGPYYSDNNAKTPPADYFNPIPVHFITVAKTSFRFIIGASEIKWLGETIKGKPITQWLLEALSTHGIGAKTAVGYGYMKE